MCFWISRFLTEQYNSVDPRRSLSLTTFTDITDQFYDQVTLNEWTVILFIYDDYMLYVKSNEVELNSFTEQIAIRRPYAGIGNIQLQLHNAQRENVPQRLFHMVAIIDTENYSRWLNFQNLNTFRVHLLYDNKARGIWWSCVLTRSTLYLHGKNHNIVTNVNDFTSFDHY